MPEAGGAAVAAAAALIDSAKAMAASAAAITESEFSAMLRLAPAAANAEFAASRLDTMALAVAEEGRRPEEDAASSLETLCVKAEKAATSDEGRRRVYRGADKGSF